jgi:hypothetical protein
MDMTEDQGGEKHRLQIVVHKKITNQKRYRHLK